MPQTFVLGSNTICKISMLPLGSRVEPVAATPTVSSGAVVKGATTITMTGPLAAGVIIPAGTYLNFKDNAGKEVLIQLSADAVTGNTTLPVFATPEVITAGSTSEFPMKLRGRTNADIGRTGNRVSSVTFDEYGYSDGLTASIEQTVTANGNWSSLDAGYATTEFAFLEKRECWIIVELPKSSDAYIKGRIYKGPGSITSAPLAVPADGIITGNLEMAFGGKPFMINPVPVP